MSVIPLTDAKAYLNELSPALDAELQTFIDAAEAAVAAKIGPLTVAAQTSRVRGWAWVLRLPVFPVVALTSVTPVGGAALDVSQLTPSPDAQRTVEWLQGGYFTSRWYDVVYTAGRPVSATTFADIYKGLLELLKHLWKTQRGSAGTRGPQPERAQAPGMAYTFPDRVNELLNPYLPFGAG